MTSKEIAIIGMAARIPGCKSIAHFWENILSGKELISIIGPSDNSVDPDDMYLRALWENQSYIKSTYILDDIDKFDAEFFGFSQREAQLTDPQFRLCLETAWEALENSGYCADKYNGTIGAFLASNMSDYLLKHLYQLVHEEMISENEFPSVYQTSMDFMTTNIAYRLNLNGPTMNIQNWCTSGLASIHMACKSLQVEDCDMALAGGVHLKLPQQGYFSHGSVSDSAEGKCRPFDEKGGGTIPSNGVAVFVLKTLDRAVADNDFVHAVIKGSAINNDGAGKNKLSYHSPSVKGQDYAVRKALADAGIDAASVRYVEAHGGATEFGDRSELTALAKNYGNSNAAKTILGCVKPNVGHMGNISGIPGFLKTVLALRHKKLPPTINFNRMAPRNEKICRNLIIGKECVDFEPLNGTPLRAAIHNYAIGGSNVHIILEEAPPTESPSAYCPRSILLVLSAKERPQLEAVKQNIAGVFNDHYHTEPADIVYTLNTGRREFERRYFCVLDTTLHAAAFENRIIYASEGSVNVEDLCDLMLYLRPADRDFFVACSELKHRYKSFRADYEKTVQEIAQVLGAPEDFISITTDPNAPGNSDSLLTGLLYITCSTCLIRLLKRLGIEFASSAADGIGEFVALHECGILSFTDMIRFYLTVNGQAPKRTTENIDTTFFPENSDDTELYYSIDRHTSVTVREIRKTNYWNRILEKYADEMPKEIYRDGHAIVDIAALSFRSTKEAANQSPTVGSNFAFDTLLGELWLRGVQIDWNEYFDKNRLKKVPLPTYPFVRKRHWIPSPILNSSKTEVKTAIVAGKTRDEIQQHIVVLWQKLLGLEKVLPTDHFDDLGGSSFMRMIFLNKLSSVYTQLKISFKDMDSHPTVEGLTSYIQEQLNEHPASCTAQSDATIPQDNLVDKGNLGEYLRSIITKLTDGKADFTSLKLDGIVKDLCFYFRRDLNLTVFTHEIETYSTIEDITHFLQDALSGRTLVKTDNVIVKNSFHWLPEKIALGQTGEIRKNRRAIFVLSTPRSGSTLLRVMLNRHSRLFAPPELGLLIYDSLPEWYEKYRVSEVSRDGLVYALMNALGVAFQEAEDYMLSLVSRRASVHEVYGVLQEKIGNKLLIDKTPYYGYRMEILQRAESMFENPFYIFLHKHPFSMIESFARNRFDKLVHHEQTNAYLMAENEWTTINQNILNFLTGMRRDKFVKVSFEQLVASPSETMRLIIEKMDMPFEPAVLNPYDNNSMLVGPGDFNLLSHDTIDPSLGDKWKRIRLPIALKDTTLAVAHELKYTFKD